RLRSRLNTRGYRIYTTIQIDHQESAEKHMTSWLENLNRQRQRRPFDNFEAFDDHGDAYPVLRELFGLPPYRVRQTRIRRDFALAFNRDLREEFLLMNYLAGEDRIGAGL